MRLVGLTGGIASGKSTVSNLFKAHGIAIVDADIVARDVLKKGTGGWKKVVAPLGQEILQLDGEVDRPTLGQIVFSDPGKYLLLNRYVYLNREFNQSTWNIIFLWSNG
ncbi:Dephospho-CoA kinase [Trema orientale]|uniref:Dephospho-CoA kinase n=1 Tax=Trema orientale TaxID=63057 RepID=A0A2P5EM62_TREOI|nr:Dephospho-CoA kinase [Trema orientale]